MVRLGDGREVLGYVTLDGTGQPMSMRSSCLYALQGDVQGGYWVRDGKPLFFALPASEQQLLRHQCSDKDVQAAEDSRPFAN
jgi:hypothetical protein